MNNPAFRKKGKTVRKVGRNIPHFNFELTDRQFVVAVGDKTKALDFLNLYDLAKKASDKEFQQAYIKLIQEMAV